MCSMNVHKLQMSKASWRTMPCSSQNKPLQVASSTGSKSEEGSCLVEGEDHAAAKDDDVGGGEERLDDGDLGADLAAAHDRRKGLLGVGNSTVKVVELL